MLPTMGSVTLPMLVLILMSSVSMKPYCMARSVSGRDKLNPVL